MKYYVADQILEVIQYMEDPKYYTGYYLCLLNNYMLAMVANSTFSEYNLLFSEVISFDIFHSLFIEERMEDIQAWKNYTQECVK